MFHLLSLVLLICGSGIPMVFDVSIPIFFISFWPKINTHFVTNFMTPRGEVPITVSPSINGSACLDRFRNDIVAQPHTNYRDLFWPNSYHWQQEMFHLSAVGVCWLIRRRDGYLLSVFFVQTECSMMVLVDCRGKIWNELYMHSELLWFPFFARNYLNFIARYFFSFIVCDLFYCFVCVWLNCFAHNYTLIHLICAKRYLTIFLVIFLSLILFLL